MYKSLYDYGKAHPDVCLAPGCTNRSIKHIVELVSPGEFVAFRQSERKSVICPDVGGATRGSGTTANVLMEKASISIGMDDGSTGDKLRRLEEKRNCFLDYFRSGAQEVPEFKVVLAALETASTMEAIRKEADKARVKPGDVVGLSVDGVLLSDAPAVMAWWRNTKEKDGGEEVEEEALDLITGKKCVPAKLFKPIPRAAAGGGQASGVSLISFNERAFESYGLSHKQGWNAPMSQDTADTIMDAIIHLGGKAPRIAGMKFLHWYNASVPQQYDVLLQGLFAGNMSEGESAVDEEAEETAATRLLTSPISGVPPAELVGCTYHILIMKPEMARMTIRHYSVGAYENLFNSFKKWFDDMTLASLWAGGYVKYKNINQLVWALLTGSEKKKTQDDRYSIVRPLVDSLLFACLNDGPLPNTVASRSLASIRSSIYDGDGKSDATNKNKHRLSPVPFQILKMWINRKAGRKEEEKLMPEADVNQLNVGYQCGRLLAVYEQIQQTVAPDVNVGVLERFYSACSQSPALTLGRLQSLSVHHFKKMENKFRVRLFKESLTEIYSKVECDIPKKLSIEDQAYFAVGYWQQMAKLNKALYSKAETQNDQQAKIGG